MKLGYGTQFGFTAIWILIGLLSGPTIVATIAAVATNTASLSRRALRRAMRDRKAVKPISPKCTSPKSSLVA